MSQLDYQQALEQYRREKDSYLKSDPSSPIPAHLRNIFRGLQYFPVNPKYRVLSRLQIYPTPQIIQMPTSQGVSKNYIQHGYFEFQIDGLVQRLNAYKQVGQPGHTAHQSLFIPFRDLTSGRETYGAGRYLDIEENPSGVYEIDFNRAYNPFCAYSDSYVCPLPPRENWLSLPIYAGEKNFPLHP